MQPIGVHVPHKSASVVVTIDHKPYCGFVDEESAHEAIVQWRIHWPAARGRIFEVISRDRIARRYPNG